MPVDQHMFSEVVAGALAQGESVLLRVQGVSMLPWLREGEKVRILPATGRRLRRGDIALFWRAPGHPILHRVVRVPQEDGGYECLGDSETGLPERVPVSAVIGVVETTVWRRWFYLVMNPARRSINHLCRKWGLRLRHG